MLIRPDESFRASLPEPFDPSWGGMGAVLPPVEFQYLPTFAADPAVRQILDVGAPAIFDLSPLSGGIYNQGQWPRCSSYSAGAIKSYEERIDRGQWFTYDVDTLFREGGGSDSAGGVMEYMCRVMQEQGAIRSGAGVRDKIASFLRASTAGPAQWIEEVKAAIASNSPIQLAVLLPTQFGWTSGMARSSGYHAMAGVGYDSEWLILQNSWGAGWGNRGFCRLAWSYLTADNWQSGYCYALKITDIREGGGDNPPPPPPPPNKAAAVLALLNQARAAAGLGALSLHSALVQAAQGYAQQLASGIPFSHTGPDGSTPFSRMQAAGYPLAKCGGENIARGFGSAETVHTAWMNSPGHRANILEARYTEVGVGVAGDGTPNESYTQDFGFGGGVTPPVGGRIDRVTRGGVAVTSVKAGDQVIIEGAGFGTVASGDVKIAGVSVIVDASIGVPSWSDGRIGVTVGRPPAGSAVGPVFVQPAPPRAAITSSFNVTVTAGDTPPPPPGDPVITDVQPQPVNVGQTLSITGSKFSPQGACGFHPGVVRAPLSWTDDLIRVQVPPGAQTGPLMVVRGDGKFATRPIAIGGSPPPPSGVNLSGKLTGTGAMGVRAGDNLLCSSPTGDSVGSLAVTQVAPAAAASEGEIGEAWMPEQNPGFMEGEIGEAYHPDQEPNAE